MAFCSKCGKEIMPNSCFCSNCGQKITYISSENNLPTPTPSDSSQKIVMSKGSIISIIILFLLFVFLLIGNAVISKKSNSSSKENIKDITNNVPVAGGLTLENYRIDDGKVKGTINTSTIARNGVYINVTTYDKNKNIIDSYSDASPALSSGQEWSFLVRLPTEDVRYYAITTVNYK